MGQYLEGDGYKVIAANDAQTALTHTDSEKIDVILLDLVLPDGEGMALIPQLQSKSKAGIIVVSGKSDTTEKIVCLEMGADDYMTKPFEMRELSARIKAVLRRLEDNEKSDPDSAQSNDNKENITFGDGWCLDVSQFQLFDKDKKSADLTTGEFKLLEAMLRSPNRALSRERLFELTRDGEYDAYDRAIDIQIGRIRKKLDDGKASGELIKTIRGVGYMFCK
jgi:DNA-binding response OmpR family regulator